MANRDGKLILRTLKNISASIEVDGGGGTKVVTELPEVGEEHIVYELHQEVPADFPWLLTMFDRNGVYPHPKFSVIVVETEEQNTQEYLKLDGDTNCFVYVKTTNKVYSWTIGEDFYNIEEIVPDDYIYYASKYTFAILKDFDYHVTKAQPGEEHHDPILDGTGHFLDGTEFNYDSESGVPLVLTDAKNPIGLNNHLLGIGNCQNINDTSELPTAKQAVDGNMCDVDGFVDYPIYITLQNKLAYWNETETDTYSWDQRKQKFGVVGSTSFVEYTGELQWDTETISVINKIDASLLDIGRVIPVFNPQPAHTEVSYWIYSNNEWVNIDEIPDPNTVKIGITCTNGDWNVPTLPLNTITVTYDDVDYRVTQYAETRVPTEQSDTVTYYGYIEVPMPTQDSLTHTFKVASTEPAINWWYEMISNVASLLNEDYPTEIQGIPAIKIYYSFDA